MNTLSIVKADALPARLADHHWLIEDLWGDQAVGIVGGEPKCCKSFLALDMAVAVASGAPCLRRFRVARKGRVLLFAAEDALHIVRDRLIGICAAAQQNLADLDLHVITAPSLRLDLETDRHLLKESIQHLSPTLLILDPFVRLHRVDENVSGEVAPLLAFLRELQREHALSVAVVHHAKKGASKARAGQALRGSSEFHAWGDSNLYLRRLGDALSLTVEHRAAPSIGAIPLALSQDEHSLALCATDAPVPLAGPCTGNASHTSARDRIIDSMRRFSAPISIAALRESCRMRTQSVTDTLSLLMKEGRVSKSDAGYSLSSP